MKIASNEQTMMTSHRKVALGLSIIPGLGQLYNRQFFKGMFFLLLSSAFIITFKDLVNEGLWGIVTLGTKPFRDHSIFLLVQGIIALLLLIGGACIYAFNLYDAYQNGKKKDEGRTVHSLKEQYHNLVDNGFPYLMISPGFFLLILVVIFPIIFMVLLAFTNYNLYNSPPARLVEWNGFNNFIDLFKMDIWRNTFISVFSWTVVWTFFATIGQIAVGMVLAIAVNQKDIKFKRVFRTIFILPWAVPAFISILIFSGMFNETFGAINNDILAFLGIDPIPWLTEPLWTKVALIFIQWWVGFPFVFAMITGVLQSIPEELYEAATIDGASLWQKFRHITLPIILFTTAPIMITQFTSNFNNFNVIYLFNGGGPAVAGQTAGSSDILISWIYELTLSSAQYGKAAAITMVLSLIVISVALWQFRRTKSFQEEDMM
ncbi:sugar ABC transporter permease [Priestia aryabhattai]|uniref:carbohydrate ABC transporter permease n=1 Tax=Bacillaceae TaxID=186817 RepID=UPI000BA04BE5|nr:MULTISPECIES: sugar ABC transporter permease [Bacillaceae]MDT2047270.1 sugar ABC transporter permease [Priestia flexa]OZT14166.1 sugar ABC transporter permease [Priestia aryabhattai]TDB55022.1 sugar ABC transporter permease [Bacillus sp. CBEL-1]